MNKRQKLFVHIVTFNHERYIEHCLNAVLDQADAELHVRVTDNASSDSTADVISTFKDKIDFVKNATNLGFSGAHNQGVKNFLDSDCDVLLILNPDVKLSSDAYINFIAALADAEDNVGLFTPKLLRSDEDLNAVEPRTLDAAGMVLEKSLRHFDRGSDQLDNGQFDQSEYVFGGTGAALFITKKCAKDLVTIDGKYEEKLYSIYPQLRDRKDLRAQLFDEAFFAYREDAELCWRAARKGWRCLYLPKVVGYHRRVVLPTNRAELPDEYNLYSVRNRFLMQFVNFSFLKNWKAIVPGLIFRNLLVVLGVLLLERSSLKGIAQAFSLLPRALERRRLTV
ncbi:MAG: glycosyltransferase [Deltaproteobacteria bacterium]|nr:glycosyltransferase [Deltaproteobacteria bacterium]